MEAQGLDYITVVSHLGDANCGKDALTAHCKPQIVQKLVQYFHFLDTQIPKHRSRVSTPVTVSCPCCSAKHSAAAECSAASEEEAP